MKRGSYYVVKSRVAMDAWTDKDGYVSPGDDGSYLHQANFKFYGKNRCIAVETDVWNLSGNEIVQDHVPPSGYFHCG